MEYENYRSKRKHKRRHKNLKKIKRIAIEVLENLYGGTVFRFFVAADAFDTTLRGHICF